MFVICQRACAASQTNSFSLYSISNVPPRFHLWHQPLWGLACKTAGLDDYVDSPYAAVQNLCAVAGDECPPANAKSGKGVVKNLKLLNTELFDDMGNQKHLVPQQRFNRLRQLFGPLEKVACKSAHGYKKASAGVIALTNELANLNVKYPIYVRPNAVDNSRRRSNHHLVVNKSVLHHVSYDKSASKTNGKKRNCRTCRDIHHQNQNVFVGHRSGSTKCPTRDWKVPDKAVKCEPVKDGEETKLATLETDDGLKLLSSVKKRKSPPERGFDKSLPSGAPLKKVMKAFSQSKAQSDRHASVHDAMTILNTRGGLIDVPSDGNCGYHVCKSILVEWGILDLSLSIGDFREKILDYGLANEETFVGVEKMGEDSSYKNLNGDIAFSGGQRKNHNPLHVRKQFYINTVLLGIFSDCVDYRCDVGMEHWMTAAHVLPLIVHMFKLPELVMFSSVSSGEPGLFKFLTDSYTYNADVDCVYFQRQDGLVHNTSANTELNLVFFDDIKHFQVFHRVNVD